MNTLKICMCGIGGVGKAPLVRRLEGKGFDHDQVYNPVIEELYQVEVEHLDNKFNLDILHTAGQEEYAALRDSFMRDNEGFLLFYSITDRVSLKDLDEWLRQIQRVKDSKHIPSVLVGTKSDLEDERKVSTEEGQLVAKRWGDVPFFETSALKGVNCRQPFHAIIEEILKFRTWQKVTKLGLWPDFTEFKNEVIKNDMNHLQNISRLIMQNDRVSKNVVLQISGISEGENGTIKKKKLEVIVTTQNNRSKHEDDIWNLIFPPEKNVYVGLYSFDNDSGTLESIDKVSCIPPLHLYIGFINLKEMVPHGIGMIVERKTRKKLLKETVFYRIKFLGRFHNGKKEGHGTEYDTEMISSHPPDNSSQIIFEGNFSKGVRSGLGKEYFSISEEKKYLKHRMSSPSNLLIKKKVLSEKNKSKKSSKHFGCVKFEGYYDNGLRSKKGIQYDFVNNEIHMVVYEGEWFKGFRNGRGEMYDSKTNEVVRGKWINGVLMENSVFRFDCPIIPFSFLKKHLKNTLIRGHGAFGVVFEMKTSSLPSSFISQYLSSPTYSQHRVLHNPQKKEGCVPSKVAVKIMKTNSRLQNESIFRMMKRGLECSSQISSLGKHSPHILEEYGLIRGTREVGVIMRLCEMSIDKFIIQNAGSIDMEEKVRILYETSLTTAEQSTQNIL